MDLFKTYTFILKNKIPWRVDEEGNIKLLDYQNCVCQ